MRRPGVRGNNPVVPDLVIRANNMQFTMIYAHTMRRLPLERPGRVPIASFVDARGADPGRSHSDFQTLRQD